MNRRPKLQLVGSSASPDEAAAVMAAVERFLRDHAPPVAAAPSAPPGWQRAALLEGVGEADAPTAWGDAHPWR